MATEPATTQIKTIVAAPLAAEAFAPFGKVGLAAA